MADTSETDNAEADANATNPPAPGQRLAKVMARAGLCSRRDAEKWIEAGRVKVNGAAVRSPALNVGEDDEVIVDGTPLPKAEPMRLWRYHKPAGLVTTSKDERGRRTVFDALPKELPRVIAVGRLDLNSEGLLLLTNDGELARRLELPETGLRRTYRVRIRGIAYLEKFEPLRNGITIDGTRYGAIEVEVENQQTSNAWVRVTLTEGKNREVRKVMEHLGFSVNRLIRVGYGAIALGDLKPGEMAEISPAVVRQLAGRPHKGAKAKPKKNKPPRKAAAKKPHGRKAAGKKGAAKPPAERDPAVESPARPMGSGRPRRPKRPNRG